MTLSLTLTGITFEGNGATTTFAYPFDIPSVADAALTFTDTDGTQSVVPSTKYSITGIGIPTGGTVTYPLSGLPIASGTLLTVQRLLPLVQTTDISYDGPVFASVESELDYLTMLAQQLNYQLSRTVQLNVADINPLPQLPPAAQRAGGFLSFDENGNPTVVNTVAGGVVVSSAMAGVVGAATRSAATNLLEYTNPATGSVVRSLGARIADFISVKDFGAVGNGSIDDTVAFQTALANMGVGTLWVPTGTYVLNQAIHLGPGQFIVGAGPAATQFLVNHAFNDIFTVSGGTLAQGAGLSGFSMSSSVPRTGGRYIYNSAGGCIIDNFTMTGAFIGIELASIGTFVTRGEIRENVNRGILVSAGNDNFISHIVMDNAVSPQPVAGLEITNGSGIFVSSVDSIRQGTGVLLGPDTGQVCNWCNFTDVDCDTCSVAGWQMQPAGTGQINGVVMENCWGSSSTNGLYIDALNGSVDGVYLTNFRCLDNGLDGIHLNKVNDYVQIGGVVSGNSIGVPLTTSGIAVGSANTNLTFSGIRVGPTTGFSDSQLFGIILGNGVDQITITGCDLVTANTSLIYGTLTPNAIIRDNRGFRNEARGEASVSVGASSVVVAHSLSIAAAISDIVLMPLVNVALAGVTRWWVSAVTPTTFTISVDAVATNTVFFGWSAAVQSAGVP